MIRTPNPALTPAKASIPNVLARVGNDVTYNADAWTGFYVAITRPTSNMKDLMPSFVKNFASRMERSDVKSILFAFPPWMKQ